MHNEPLISVIIYVKKTTEGLKKCLDTLFFQLYKNIEIICIDTGLSPENTALLYTYQTKFDKFKIFHSFNSNSAQAWNEGLKTAQGEYVHFVNSDCWFLLDLYKVFVSEAVQKNADVNIINSALYNGKIIDIPFYELFDDEDLIKTSDDMVYSYKDIRHIITKNIRVLNKIYKKEFLENNNISFLESNHYCEYLFNIQTLIKSSSVYINPEAYMRNREQYIVEDTTDKVFDIFEILSLIERFLISEDIFKYYLFDVFNFICNSLNSYYKYCPESLKREYFERLRIFVLNRLNTMPPEIQNNFKKIADVNFIVTSTFEEYNNSKGKI